LAPINVPLQSFNAPHVKKNKEFGKKSTGPGFRMGRERNILGEVFFPYLTYRKLGRGGGKGYGLLKPLLGLATSHRFSQKKNGNVKA